MITNHFKEQIGHILTDLQISQLVFGKTKISAARIGEYYCLIKTKCKITAFMNKLEETATDWGSH